MGRLGDALTRVSLGGAGWGGGVGLGRLSGTRVRCPQPRQETARPASLSAKCVTRPQLAHSTMIAMENYSVRSDVGSRETAGDGACGAANLPVPTDSAR